MKQSERIRDSSWVLGLPGLRRYGYRLAQMSRRLEKANARIARLQRSLAHSDERVRRLKATIQTTRRKLLVTEPLYQTLSARHAALTSAAAKVRSVSIEDEFRRRSPSYAAALDDSDDLAHSGRAERVSVHGLAFWIPQDAYGAYGARLRRGWLPFREILAQRELGVGNVMLDIGANIGMTAIPRVIAGDVQRIYAAEPEPLNYACLVRNVVENNLRGLVMPEQAAISDHDGEIVLRRSKSMSNHVLLADPSQQPDEKGVRRIRVPSLTVDTWLDRLGIEPQSIGVVKVDTQGWESHVLAGAPRLLTHKHIAWIIEFAPDLLDRSGRSTDELLDQIAKSFSHFIDTKGAAGGPRVAPVEEIRSALAYLLGQGTRTFTDLILYNAS